MLRALGLRRLIGLPITLVACLAATRVVAEPVLVDDARELAIAATGLGCAISEVTFTPSAPFARFSESHTLPADSGGFITATQNSAVQASSMGGTGMVSTTAGTSHFCGISLFQVTFQLNEATAYLFDGWMTTGDDEAHGFFALYGGSTVFLLTVSGFDSQSFVEAGILPPGEYTMRANLVTGATGAADFDFSLVLHPPAVPGIGSAGLFALAGSLVLVARVALRSRPTTRSRGPRWV